MTQPTIEGVVGYCFNVEYSSLPPDLAREKIKSLIEEYANGKVHAALTAQAGDGNRLPLEEVPEGWELAFISHGKFGDGATFSAQIRRIVSHTIRYAYGTTPAEALRAAIKKVKP